jgi:hypothetical protein
VQRNFIGSVGSALPLTLPLSKFDPRAFYNPDYPRVALGSFFTDARRMPMIERRLSFDDSSEIKRALMMCLALALLGGLATVTGVAMVAFLLLTNSHM